MNPNIFDIMFLPFTFLFGSRRAAVPQKVKKSTTCIPMAAAPVAMIMAASCRSRLPENTTMVSLFPVPGRGFDLCLELRELPSRR